MFQGCRLLRELDLSIFRMNKLKEMSGMFSECRLLKF